MTAPIGPISFRPLENRDLVLLHEWLQRPHVAEWWGPCRSLAEVEAEYGPLTGESSPTRAYIALVEGSPLGYIQSYVAKDSGDGWWTNENDPGVRGIDQFLADPTQLGRGLGSAMIRAFVRNLFRDPGVTRVQADPRPDNARAIRAYEKAGFHAAGEIVTPDGPALLMRRDRPPALPLRLGEFAATIDIQGGRLRYVILDVIYHYLYLGLRCGDERRGFFDLGLTYYGVDDKAIDAADLRAMVEDPRTEAVYHEVDAGAGGLFEHRWLFRPDRGLEIAFRDFAFDVTPQSDADDGAPSGFVLRELGD